MPDRDEIRARLSDVFRDVFDDDTISVFDAMTADDVDGWDSVTHITLVLMVERKFGVKFRAAEVGELKNVGQLIDLVALRAK